MVLHLVSDLNHALRLKVRLKCPHIHFIIEEECDAFTTSLVWMEVLTRGADICKRDGLCIISYSDLSRYQDTLSNEDIEFFQKMQKTLNEKMKGIEVIKNEGLGR
jgi:hypothetical protein